MARGEAGGDRAPGLIESFRGLTATAVGIARTRLQLLSNELEEQRMRMLQLAFVAAIALVCGVVAVLLASAWIVVALWEQYRLWTLGLLVLFFAAACLLALSRLKAQAAERPKVFAASLAELARDEEALRP